MMALKLPLIVDAGVTALLVMLFVMQTLLPVFSQSRLFPIFKRRPRCEIGPDGGGTAPKARAED